MATTIVHIADYSSGTRRKTCDGTPLTPPDVVDGSLKELCEKCREKILELKGV